ncbi:MAG: DsbA family protein [Gemmatimonadota bacterium]
MTDLFDRSMAPDGRVADDARSPRRGGKWVDWLAAFTLTLAGMGGAAIVTAWWIAGDGLLDADATTVNARLDPAEFARLTSSGQWLGERNAPAVLLVYNDYRCSFCKTLDASIERLRSKYPQHFAVVFHHFVDPSTPHRRQYLVPEGAECAAEQGVFEAFHHTAFANAGILGYSDAARILAQTIEIPSPTAFLECVSSRRHASTVAEHYQEGAKLGVAATPTMFLNGNRMIGALPLTMLDSLIVGEFRR